MNFCSRQLPDQQLFVEKVFTGTIFFSSLVDPTLAAFIVCGPMQFLVSQILEPVCHTIVINQDLESNIFFLIKKRLMFIDRSIVFLVGS